MPNEIPPDKVADIDAQIAGMRNQVDELMRGMKPYLSTHSPEYITAVYATTELEFLRAQVQNGLCLCDIARFISYLTVRIAKLELENQRLKGSNEPERHGQE